MCDNHATLDATGKGRPLVTPLACIKMAEPDISKHFTCFLCNGQITVLGFVELEETCMRLGCANG